MISGRLSELHVYGNVWCQVYYHKLQCLPMFVSSELLLSLTSSSFVALHLPISKIAECVAQPYIAYSYENIILCLLPSFILTGFCIYELHVPIIIGLFIVVLQELQCLLNCLHVLSSEL